jgi:predicted PurR-regulated permease PerM
MEKLSLPNVYKVSAAFFIIVCTLVATYLANDIIAPLITSLLFAILLRPAVKFMTEKMKFPHLLAVSITVVLAISVLASLIIFLGSQLTSFLDDLPTIKIQLEKHYHSIQRWIQETMGLSYKEQNEYVGGSVSGKDLISMSSITMITNSLMHTILVPIYTFLILIYRSLLLNFIIKLTPNSDVVNIQQILTNLKSVVRSYIVGLLIQVACISTMTGIGYYLIGIEYYIFLGVLTGLLNLIPYIGIIIAGIISCLIALTVSEDLSIILWILGVNAIVQFIDNNFLVPKVVGSKVSINALASMIGVIIGGTIAGISGMFLAIPVLAMLKVIFESTKGLEPYGYLISDEIPKSFNWTKIRLMYNQKARLKEEENKTKDPNETTDNPNNTDINSNN